MRFSLWVIMLITSVVMFTNVDVHAGRNLVVFGLFLFVLFLAHIDGRVSNDKEIPPLR